MKTIEEKATDYADSLRVSDSHLTQKQIEEYAITDFLAGYKAAQEWISVDDELPQYTGQEFSLLLKDSSGEIFIGYIEEESDITDCIHHYTHWKLIN